MAITIDAQTFQPVTPSPQIAAQAVPPVLVRESNSSPRRDSKNSRDERNGASSFRAVLQQARVSGAQASSGSTIIEASTAAADSTPDVPRPTKLPQNDPTELDASESTGLLGAAQLARTTSTSGTIALDRPYLAATSRYAQTFFAGQPTFARRGESLELTA